MGVVLRFHTQRKKPSQYGFISEFTLLVGIESQVFTQYFLEKNMVARQQAFSEDKFKCFVRYMIQAAKQKRCIPYVELENVFGLGHGQVGWYAGMLGDYCNSRKLPLLNGLIISSTDCTPSQGFDWYQKQYKKSWGQIVTECWKEFHVTASRAKQSEGFSKRDADVSAFIAAVTVPEYKE